MLADDRFVEIPGTRFVALANDPIASAMAVRDRTLAIEPDGIDSVVASLRMPPGAVVLDIGAFIGYVTRSLLDRGYAVHAFEPQADAFACLSHNCPEAVLRNVAVGDGRCVRLCSEPSESNGNLGSRQLNDDPSGDPTLRIDDLHLDRVDFIKLDVEGFEPAVLDGSRRTIARCRPALLFEVYPAMMGRYNFSLADMVCRIPDDYRWRVVIGSAADSRYDVLARPIG